MYSQNIESNLYKNIQREEGEKHVARFIAKNNKNII